MDLLSRFRFLVISVALLSGATALRSESLGFSSLKKNEVIVVLFVSTGCFHHIERKYVVRGGERDRIEVYELKTEGEESNDQYSGPEHFVAHAWLSEREIRGLDSYLYYLRTRREGFCTTVQNISLGYYRDDVKIGEEHFQDSTCGLSIYRVEGKSVYDEESHSGIPANIYKSIVTPELIEQRIMEKLKPQQ